MESSSSSSSSASDGLLAGTIESQPFHGILADQGWHCPIKTVHCDKVARPGYDSLPAHEYEEHAEVFQLKIALMARLLNESSKCIAYTGAGISTSSGIADYASVSAGKDSNVASLVQTKTASVRWYEMRPSPAHLCLTELYHRGILKWWCQQNHDGLPQKAGMPQTAMNEIHGSWWDPSNPVVPMSGELRGDLYQDLLDWEKKCDVCIAVGTSLCGMSADSLVETCGERALKTHKNNLKRSQKKSATAADLKFVGGSIIIGFQRTRLDEVASLRIYSSIDKVMIALAEHMRLDLEGRKSLVSAYLSAIPQEGDLFELPGYCPEDGTLSHPRSRSRIVLNLQVGSKVRITNGIRANALGEVMDRTKDGHYKILFQVPLAQCNKKVQERHGASAGAVPGRMKTAPMNMMLGRWMIEAARDGQLPQLPVVNC